MWCISVGGWYASHTTLDLNIWWLCELHGDNTRQQHTWQYCQVLCIQHGIIHANKHKRIFYGFLHILCIQMSGTVCGIHIYFSSWGIRSDENIMAECYNNDKLLYLRALIWQVSCINHGILYYNKMLKHNTSNTSESVETFCFVYVKLYLF